jgi:penicillin-insensitive murein endopeptidase
MARRALMARLIPTIRPMLGKAMLKPLLILALIVAAPVSYAEESAKQLFGAQTLPADMTPQPIGFYAKGCMAGAVQLPPDGPTWQAMRLSRNRQWGLPTLVDFIEDLSRNAAAKDGWPGLLVGDMSEPRGGPMVSGHASHQIGLDVDLWLTPMPSHKLSESEREKTSAESMVEPGPHVIPANSPWTAAHGRVIKRAALDPRVERIFVAPGIKKELCSTAGSDRDWLRKVRPYYGHNDHFHVRLFCPPGASSCKEQAATPAGDGCGKDLDYWFSAAPYKPPPKPTKPPKPARPMMLSDLPPACTAVLAADPVPSAMTMRQAFAVENGAPVPADAGLAYVTPAAADGSPAAAAAADAAPLPRPRPEDAPN